MFWLIFTICLLLLLIFLIINFFFTRHYILLTGSASSEYVRTFLGDKYQISYEPTTNEYKLNSSTQLIVKCDLNKAAFDLKSFELKYNEIKDGLKQIVCIENLNPRPETLEADLNVLSKVINSKELRNYLFIVFKSSTKPDSDLSEIRSSSANFNVLFNALGLKSQAAINKYIGKQIWTEATFRADRFKGMHLVFKILTISIIVLGCILGLSGVQRQKDKFEFLSVYDKMVDLTYEFLCNKDKKAPFNAPVCEQNFSNTTIESNSAALGPMEIPKVSWTITENLLTISQNVTVSEVVKEYASYNEIDKIVDETKVVTNVTRTTTRNITTTRIKKEI